jgi:hypothetical protein
MNRPCDKVELFVDGELPEDVAETFRRHLPDCTHCQNEMERLMQLRFLSQSYAERVGLHEQLEERYRAPSTRWRFWAILVVAGPVLALGVALMVRTPSAPTLKTDVWLAKSDARLLEARVSYPGADVYRPTAARNMGGADSFDTAPSLDDMEWLEEHRKWLQAHDPHGLAAGLLVRPNKKWADMAKKELENLGDSPDLLNDRAVALMTLGKLQDALELLDGVLDVSPRHAQALWNRGLVLSKLEMPLQAVQAFSEVAALKEPGWAEEAEKRIERLLRETNKRRERWENNTKLGESLLKKVPESSSDKKEEEVFLQFISFPSTRRHLYEAVRGATTRDQVLALLPLAKKLDEGAGGNVLESYVRRVSEADFSRRAPLSQRYRSLQQNSPDKEKEQLLAQLLVSKEDDIILGVLSLMNDISESSLTLLDAKAQASGDPWFQLLAVQMRAEKEVDWDPAAGPAQIARRLCEEGGIEYRCIILEFKLSNIYLKKSQFDLSRSHARRGLEMALRGNEWQAESSFLWLLAQLARMENATALNEAYLKEFNEHRGKELDAIRRTAQENAVMAMEELRLDDARREIDKALATNLPLGLPGIFALADISRQRSATDDEKHLLRSVQALTETLGPGEQAIVTHVLGRFYVGRKEQKEKGLGLLQEAIEKAEALLAREDNAEARRARAYSFTSLVFEASERGDFQQVLELLQRERRMELPSRCLLVASMDAERLLFLARGNDGKLEAHYEGKRAKPLPQQLHNQLPQKLVTVLKPCERVDVLARPPLHGRVGLLSSRVAWSYLTRSSLPRAARPDPAIHLVVFDVKLPEDTELGELNAWEPSFGPEEEPRRLSGRDATPSNVLRAMEDATEIDLVAHGTLNDFSNAAYLMLAQDQKSRDSKLDVFAVRKASLKGAPFVVLAACYAANPTYSVDNPLSLPAAFIEAGARGVLAATVEIPDREAQAFFNAVRKRMRDGAAPALALRDERVQWLDKGRGQSWLDSVLLFE